MNEQPIYWLIAMLKGGVRKSTSAMLTAMAAATEQGHEVLVIDADARTQGVTDWASRVYAGGGELPVHVAQWSHTAGLLIPFIHDHQRRTGATLVIIDCGAEVPEVVAQAATLVAAHRPADGARGGSMVIMPCGPEQGELARLAPTQAVLRGAGDPMSAVLLTRVPAAGRGVSGEVRHQLMADGYRVLPTEIPQQRDTYAHVWGTVPGSFGCYSELAAYLLALAGGKDMRDAA